MIQLILLIIFLITSIFFPSIFCAKKKKIEGGKQTNTDDDPPSKKCNTRGGLLADDPDLKSLKMKLKDQKVMAEQQQSALTPTSKKPSTTENNTDLKSFDDKNAKKKEALQLEQQRAMSAYANKNSVNNDGISVLAMEKIDKDKLPVKMAPKELEVIAQDPTQSEHSKHTKSSHTGSKKAKSQNKNEGRKKTNLEELLDGLMDKTQSTEEDPPPPAPPTKAQPKISGEPVNQPPPPVAPKTKLAEVKTQVPTKILDLESGRSEKNKKAPKKVATQKSMENAEKKEGKVRVSSKRH